MFVAIDAVGIRGHGGAAVLCELLHWFPLVRPMWRWHVFVFERSLREFTLPDVAETIVIERTDRGNSGWGRLQWIHKGLQRRIDAIQSDVIFSFANIGAAKPVIPQVIFLQQHNIFSSDGLSRNSITRRLKLKFMRQQILAGALASVAVIVQTQSMHDRIFELEPKLKDRLHVIPSGYRTHIGNHVIRQHKKAIIEKAGHPRLIYVSHPSEHKNHVNLIKSLPGMIKIFPNLHLLLTIDKHAPPNPRYQSFVREIAASADSLGVSDHVVWTGILSADEVHYALSNCALMVFPSLAESFGLGLVEALAAGCPVAASDLDYAHDVLGKSGAYFDPRDPRSIADVVSSTLSDPNRIYSMIQEAVPILKRCSYENISEQIAALLHKSAGT